MLAALFESFRDPLIILVSVPPAIAGAMAAMHIVSGLGVFFPDVMQFGGASLNIYTIVGLVTLVGLISKHGILIVDVANRLQSEGYAKRDAVEEAAGVRLRPILMTTAAMVLGVMPLLFANGAGAAARFAMGLTISSGIAIGTLFTLFVVPAFYVLIAEDHSKGGLSATIGTARCDSRSRAVIVLGCDAKSHRTIAGLRAPCLRRPQPSAGCASLPRYRMACAEAARAKRKCVSHGASGASSDRNRCRRRGRHRRRRWCR